MSVYARVFVLFQILLLGFCGSVLGYPDRKEEHLTGRGGVGFNISGSIPTDNELDNAMYYGGNVSYGIMDYLVFQFDIGYHQLPVEAFGTNYGDLKGRPVLFSLQWRKPFHIGTSPAGFYLLGGLGYIDWSFDNSQAARDNNVTVNAEDSFGLRLGAGFDIFFHRNWAWNIEGTYTFSGEQLNLVQPGGDGRQDLDTDFWLLGTGVRLYF